jgi:predicted P-loop ATPase
MSEYNKIQEIIEKYFAHKLSIHKGNHDIYLDGELFNIGKFRAEVAKKYNVVLDNDKYIYELISLYSINNPFSPIEDYLNQCFSNYQDTNYKELFRYINEQVLHIDPDSFEALYLPKTLVAAVKRIYEPGCQHDTVLILKSKEQGWYKTSFFRELVSRDWFETTQIVSFNKDELMVCHSKWILELGECEGTIMPHAMSKLKAFITKQSDSFRKPYAPTTITVPRQFILVGTTNQDKFLHDPTGSRRFWIIEINQKIDIDWVKQNRDVVWAAAVLAYKDNYPTYLNEIEQQLSNSVNAKKYQFEDMWTEIITNWVIAQTEPFTLSDVLTKALKKEVKSWKRSDENRVTAILQSLGFNKPDKSTRVKDKVGKYYYPITNNILAEVAS